MSTITIPDEFYTANMKLLAQNAEAAAATLAAMEEWAPAGMMLRVAQITRDRWQPKASHPLAVDAWEKCLTDDGKAACSAVIEIIARYIP